MILRGSSSSWITSRVNAFSLSSFLVVASPFTGSYEPCESIETRCSNKHYKDATSNTCYSNHPAIPSDQFPRMKYCGVTLHDRDFPFHTTSASASLCPAFYASFNYRLWKEAEVGKKLALRLTRVVSRSRFGK